MRLQCPNCDAEYEVDASAIPYEGRDVQCSNCGHGWFQAHPDFETDYDVESSLYDPPPPLPQGGDVAGAIPKRELAPEAMQILREEVALEEAKRAEEAARAAPIADPADGGIEAELDAMVAGDVAGDIAGEMGAKDLGLWQADPQDEGPGPPEAAPDGLGDIEAALDAGNDSQAQAAHDFVAPMPRVAPRRVARLKGLGEDSAAHAAPYPAPAQETASAQETAPTSGPDETWAEPDDMAQDAMESPDLRANLSPAKPRKSGGRGGFYTAILAAILGTAGYVLGPELGKAVPALAGPMDSYASAVNSLRDQVQVMVPQILGAITGAAQGVMAWVSAQGWF